MRIAIFEAMDRDEGDQRLWFVIDEQTSRIAAAPSSFDARPAKHGGTSEFASKLIGPAVPRRRRQAKADHPKRDGNGIKLSD
jgi:hypothetical protein